MAYPNTIDDNSTLPPKSPGQLITSTENNLQIEAIKALESRVGIVGTSDVNSVGYRVLNHVHTGGDGGAIAHSSLTGLTSGDPHTQYILKSIVTSKGDLLVATASGTLARLGPDTDGKVLTLDSTQTLGVRWATPTGGGGSAIIWQQNDVTLTSSATTVDFGPGFDLTESPAGEVNIVLDASEVSAAPVAVGTSNVAGSASTFSPSDHVHQALAHDHSTSVSGINLAPAGTFQLTGDITPTTLSADTNDWNPTGLATASIIRASASVAISLTSLAGGVDGRLIYMFNPGSFAITLKNENTGIGGSNTAANRFAFGGADAVLGAGAAIAIVYDATSSRWRLVGAPGTSGAPSTPVYAIAAASADALLPNSVAIGASPAGELGGTWASPTVDTTHSGSAHHDPIHALDDIALHTGQLDAGTQLTGLKFSKTVTVLSPATGTTIMTWRAEKACTVTNVRAHFKGGTSVVYNARKNQASNHLSSNQTASTANAWADGGSVQNTTYAAGDDLEVMFVTINGGVTEASIQVDFTYP